MVRQPSAQIKWDWTLFPAVQSLNFISNVNMSSGIGITRQQLQGYQEPDHTETAHRSLLKVYRLLHDGHYMNPDGTKSLINGDIRKLPYAIGLTDRQRSMVRQFVYTTESIAGTRQVRRRIGDLMNSACVVYGLPIFCTLTPSERHNGLALRLMRYRRNDPAVDPTINNLASDMRDFIREDYPSMQSSNCEEAWVDIPEYELRKVFMAKDALCAVDAFAVDIKCRLATLFGMRMCPDCPRCTETANPCMDQFGSCAEPLGGILGRPDGLVGSVEAQKTEGVLHTHFHIFVQIAWQFKTLHEIASMIEKKLLNPSQLKEYASHCRKATYPDVKAFESERDELERAWPTYSGYKKMCKAPPICWRDMEKPANAISSEEDAKYYCTEYDLCYQETAKRVLNRVHPKKWTAQGKSLALENAQVICMNTRVDSHRQIYINAVLALFCLCLSREKRFG